MSRSRSAGTDQAPFEDDYRSFDVREDETARGPLILALAVGVLIIFGGVVWNTYRQGVRPEGAALPTVLAETNDYKRVPDDPGGKAIPHVDKHFYDGMDGRERRAVIEPAVVALEGSAGMESLTGGPPADLRPREPDPAAPPVAEALPPAESAEPAPVSRELPAPEPIAPLMSAPRFAFAEDGAYLVQIAALRSEEAAETAWKRASSAAPELYKDATKHIQRADLGANGVFYRLRIGAFADRSEASAFCEALKETGANCIVVTG